MATKKSSAAAPKKQEEVAKEKEHKHLDLEKEVSSLKSALQALKKIVEDQSAALRAHEELSQKSHADIISMINQPSLAENSSGMKEKEVKLLLKTLVLQTNTYHQWRNLLKRL